MRNNWDQNVSNISNDKESNYGTGISNGEASDIVELPCQSTKSKIKKISLLAKIKSLTELCHNIKATEEQSTNDILSLVDDAILIAKGRLDSVNDVLVERGKTPKENKKQTFWVEKKKIGEFLSLAKRQTKHPAVIRVGVMADIIRHWYRIKLSLEDVCDSKSKNLINVKKEHSRPLSIKNESSRKEQDIPDGIISKICKNDERE